MIAAGAWTLAALTLAACGDPPPDGPRAAAEPQPTQVVAGPAPTAAPPPGARDLLIITVDTLRADAIDHPNMQALASRGLRFDQATTPMPRTTPALGSMLSGLLPARHGSEEVGRPLTVTPGLVPRFREAGWHTLAFSGTPVASPDQGLHAGFEHFEVWADPPAPTLVDAAVARLPTDERPILLWVHLTDPHFPYLPQTGPPAPRCRELGQAAAARTLSRSWIFGDLDGRASAARDDCAALYRAEVAQVDAALPALWEALDDPWIVLSSDHGENMGEDGLYYEHGPSLHDASMRIPLLLAGPGIQPGVDQQPATLQDLAPTLLALAGLPPLSDIDGRDLLGADRPDAATAVSGSVLQERLNTWLRSGRASGRHCLNVRPWSLCSDGLFDHVADPYQRNDLSAQHPDVVARLQPVAARWPPEQTRERAVRTPTHKLRARPAVDGDIVTLHRLPDEQTPIEEPLREQLLQQLPAQVGGPAADTSPDPVEALRALGYVE